MSITPSHSVDGISFTEALLNTYFDICDPHLYDNDISFPTLAGGTKSLEYSRCDKLYRQLTNFSNRTELCCRSMKINRADIKKEVVDQFQNVRTLDISSNLLSSWEEVIKILQCFPNLNHLALSDNPLPSLCDKSKISNFTFGKLKMLTLGRTNYTWNDFVILSELLWPNVEFLDLFSNNISFITSFNSFQSLKTLVLSENPISDWNEVCQLGDLKIEDLQLVYCGIKSIEIKKPVFLSLKRLNLKNNQLTSFEDIAQLNNLPVLEDLIIRGNPVINDLSFTHLFNFILSIIGNLKKLNKQQITFEQRKDGEIYYLRYFHSQYSKALEKNEIMNFLRSHPRYTHLLEVYGPPIGLYDPLKEQNKFISVNIVNNLTNEEIIKKLPKKIKVLALKVMVKRLLNYDDYELIEIIASDPKKEHKYPLEDENKTLDYYCVEDGYTLICMVK